MLRLVIITALLAPQLLLGSQYLDGIWVNDRYKKKIEVFVEGDRLEVYGVRSNRGHKSVFWRISKRKFEDNRGNRIKIEDDGCLEFRYFHSWRKVRFRKAMNTSRYYQSDRQGECRPDSRNATLRNSISGVWYSPKTDRELVVEEERYGFRIRFKRDGDWRYFERIRSGLYRDNKGNTYRLNQDGTMTWESYDRDRIVTIHRKGHSRDW